MSDVPSPAEGGTRRRRSPDRTRRPRKDESTSAAKEQSLPATEPAAVPVRAVEPAPAQGERVPVTQQPLPWHQRVSAVVPVLALLFSLGTFALSAYWSSNQNDRAEERLAQEEVQASRDELRSLLQRLYEIGGASQGGSTNEYVTAELMLLSQQAFEIANRIPDHVSTVEYVSVGQFLALNGSYADARVAYERALERVTSASDYVVASRALGGLLLVTGDIEAGRRYYQQALDVASVFPDEVDSYLTFQHGQTEASWAQAELARGQCAEAERHLAEAGRYAEELNQPATESGYRVLQNQVRGLRQLMDECEPATPAS
jgi:tetratricopeptide (TPR) repeat protein